MHNKNKVSCIWEKGPIGLIPDVISVQELEHLVEGSGVLGWFVYDVRDVVNTDGFFSSKRELEEINRSLEAELAGYEYRVIGVQTDLDDRIHAEPAQVAVLVRQEAA